MIIDSSAILFDEADAPELASVIAGADRRSMSAVNFVEAAARYAGRNGAESIFDDFMRTAGVDIEPVTVEQALLARAAYARYGRGMGHPARLNLGDCFAYALARARDEPLLFKGSDFVHTDVRSAL